MTLLNILILDNYLVPNLPAQIVQMLQSILMDTINIVIENS